MLELAMVITKGAFLRNEFRGAHYKPEFPERDDKNWLKTTLATYHANLDEPLITYEPVDLRHLKADSARLYDSEKSEANIRKYPGKPSIADLGDVVWHESYILKIYRGHPGHQYWEEFELKLSP